MLWFPRFSKVLALALVGHPSRIDTMFYFSSANKWKSAIADPKLRTPDLSSRESRVLSKIVQPLKSLKFSQNADFWNLIFFTKFTFLKSQFSQNSHSKKSQFLRENSTWILWIIKLWNCECSEKIKLFFLLRKMWSMWKIRTFPKIPIFCAKIQCEKKIKLSYCEKCELCEKSGFENVNLIEKSSF